MVLIFTPSDTDTKYVRQRNLLQDQRAGFEERDLLSYVFFDESPDGDAPREQFGVENETFTVVLVGKDGGEKFRWQEPVEPGDLFDRIDVMPMRRRELREGSAR